MANSRFYTVSSSSSNGSTTDAQEACSSKTSFLHPNRISDTQANSLEDYVEVQLCCTIISVRIYSVFSLWYFQIFCEEFLDNNGALTGNKFASLRNAGMEQYANKKE